MSAILLEIETRGRRTRTDETHDTQEGVVVNGQRSMSTLSWITLLYTRTT